MATDPEMLDWYFDLLEKTMTENDLLDKPCQIYNVDETGLPLDPKAPQLIFQQGEKNLPAVGSGNKAQITVVRCVSAGGSCLPPMVIWDRKTHSPELTVGEVPGTIYGLSEKGWIDQELFEVWFLNHFLRYASHARSLLLLLDGHSSNFCPETIQAAATEQVILFVLPPNTTHLTQPLDKGCFGPLKAKWREVCHAYSVNNPGKVICVFAAVESGLDAGNVNEKHPCWVSGNWNLSIKLPSLTTWPGKRNKLSYRCDRAGIYSSL